MGVVWTRQLGMKHSVVERDGVKGDQEEREIENAERVCAEIVPSVHN